MFSSVVHVVRNNMGDILARIPLLSVICYL